MRTHSADASERGVEFNPRLFILSSVRAHCFFCWLCLRVLVLVWLARFPIRPSTLARSALAQGRFVKERERDIVQVLKSTHAIAILVSQFRLREMAISTRATGRV